MRLRIRVYLLIIILLILVINVLTPEFDFNLMNFRSALHQLLELASAAAKRKDKLHGRPLRGNDLKA
ncbi:unnamed protein product [Caenorhabditis angaria]|uniref:Uncharacterized protein n=1 Tax=Caenorhabditis angaria TaxID=860376 RepID=A0A9P1IDJ7_9PELO|nr:unnamed protein product [Caenorhabditis angaria]